MAIPNELVEQIISHSDIVEIINNFITLSKKGQSYVCLCPFHEDNDPSMHIEPKKQIFKCFVCNTGGNVVTFLMKYKKWSFNESMQFLAQKAGIVLDSSFIDSYVKKDKYSEQEHEVIKLLDRANSFFKFEFNKFQKNTLKDFYNKRHLTEELLDEFDIGYANQEEFKNIFEDELNNNIDLLVNSSLVNSSNFELIFRNRVTFAIRDENNNVVGFSARTLEKDEKPKYLNSAERGVFKKSHLLYNYFRANEANNEELIITEGFFDVIALYKSNLKNAVCLMGTALTDNHLPLLKGKKIILFLDGDEAGQKASLKSALFLVSHNFDVKIVRNLKRLDPDELLNEFGQDYVHKLVNEAPNVYDFVYEYLANQNNLVAQKNNDINKILNFVNEYKKYLKFAKEELKNFYISRIKKDFYFDLKFDEKDAVQDLPILEDSNYDDLNYQNLVENYGFLNSGTWELNQKQNQLNKNLKIDWIDKLFYILLSHPSLIKLFKAKEQEEQLHILTFDNFKQKQKIYDCLIHYNAYKKEELEKILQELKNDSYDIILSEFSHSLNDSKTLKENFEEIYKRALKDSDEEYRRYSGQEHIMQGISSNPKMYQEYKEKMRKINKRREYEQK